MKNLRIKIIIILNFISSFIFSQQYDSLFIEKKRIDDNDIYKIGKVFYYKIKEDTVQNNNLEGIKLSVIKSNIFTRTNKNQTEISYTFYPFSYEKSRTGLVENNKNIWLHPPRINFLKYLETCPFPYVILNKSKGYRWSDSMLISDYWSSTNGGKWTGNLLLNYDYEILEKEIINTRLGEIECIKISSKATSKIGNSYLIAYFSNKYGFVKLDYTLFTGKKISLELEKVEIVN